MMDKQQDNKCYLHVDRVDDKFIVVDDLGRQVAMTRNIAISSGYDEVTEILSDKIIENRKKIDELKTSSYKENSEIKKI
jgi:hypothetical protein